MKRDKVGSTLVTWGGLFLCFLLFIVVILTFRVKNMSLYTHDTEDYNDGFTLVRPDGSMTEITLPYTEDGTEDSVYSLVKTLKAEDAGKTLFFMTSNSYVSIYVDDKLVYSFGNDDVRLFSQTPGDMTVFADIPEDAGDGSVLRIEERSPYAAYSGDFSAITIGTRDQCILKFIAENMPKLAVALCTTFCILVMMVLFLLKLKMKYTVDPSELPFILFSFLMTVWSVLETSVGIIFFANQSLANVFAYLALFSAPILASEFEKARLPKIRFALTACQHIEVGNIIVQSVLQVTNICDFRDMFFVTAIIIAFNSLVVAYGFVDKIKEKQSAEFYIEAVGCGLYVFGMVIDIARTLMGLNPDILNCTRWTLMVYVMIMFVISIKNYIHCLSERYIDKAEGLEHENEDVREANDVKTQFLSNVSHEVRTPINTIMGYSEMIIRQTHEIETGEFATNIGEAGKSLLSIFDDIMDYTGMEEGKVSLDFEEYSAREMVQTLANYARYRADKEGLKLNVSCDEHMPLSLKGDMERLLQIMRNLVSNAIKYTREGQVDVEYRWIPLNDTSGTIVMSVKDTGIGMKQEDVEKISEAFTRFDNRNTRNISGIGLGLSIVSRLVKMMDGKLEIESTFGKGSTFTCYIHQDVVDPEPVGHMNFTKFVPEVAISDETSFTARKARILAADDNAMNLELLKRVIQDTQITVDTATNGREALRLMKDTNYQIVIMDHMMPVMDGIEALHAMRDMDLCHDAKVIAFTANAVSGERDMYLNEGFDDYITKPVNREKLLTTIRKFLPADMIDQEETEGTASVQTENVRRKVMIIDDDVMSIKIATRILSKEYDVTNSDNSEEALRRVVEEKPDLILLDVHMPVLDGFAVISRLKLDDNVSDIPVIFLTGDEDQKVEVACFKAGASDFIRKPFSADIVLQRVGRLIELNHLRKNLQDEVQILTASAIDKKNRMEALSVEMMVTLAATIDAKDKYTNGHSKRVAKYSREIARRMGKSEKDQNEIYYMGLLHDIGKIGVPDSVINSKTRLTDEQYALIKKHPVIGADILKNISGMSYVADGARWHHERYDGKGYPDGLKGEEIPERARIIAVADAYDAMTSNRSYRNYLDQSVVRAEIVKGKGSQFDPAIADVMLQMIDDDVNFEMKEDKKEESFG